MFLLTITTVAFSQISDIEKNALIDLYKSTNGENWNNSWDLSTDVNTWHGVTVSNNSVTKLNLSMNNLEGIIPSTIGNLNSLVKLNLGFNKLQGIIPSEICQNKSLESIELFMNQLEGKLPSDIGEISNLKELTLFNNLLSGELPASIYKLENLKT